MVATTILADWELNQPTGDRDIDDLLAEARSLTGDNLQIVITRNEDRRLFFKNRVWCDWQLYVEVSGVFHWQVINCASTRQTIFAYLCGIINGFRANHH